MFKKFVAPVVIAGVLLGGATAATAGVASAASPTTASAPAGHHALKSWIRAHRRQIRQAALAVSAKSIGISPQALRAELKSGKSVAQVAGEHGVAAQTVIGALVGVAVAVGHRDRQALLGPGHQDQGRIAGPGGQGRQPRVLSTARSG